MKLPATHIVTEFLDTPFRINQKKKLLHKTFVDIHLSVPLSFSRFHQILLPHFLATNF